MKLYVDPGTGTNICTPPPTNGTCPPYYVLTILNGEQYCSLEQVR
jgi:hypothetical protein